MKLSNSKFKLALSWICITSAICFANNAVAQEEPKVVVDVFGTKQISSEVIKKKYSNELAALAKAFSAEDFKTLSNTKLINMDNTRYSIRHMGDFSYFNLSAMKSASDKNIYVTIDVVDNDDTSRLNYFFPQPHGTISDPDNLIALWGEYQKAGFAKMLHNKDGKIWFKSCPALNCTAGFDDPELKKYKNIFLTQVPNDKDQLITILKDDKDEDKRASAAFLLGHIVDANELITILVPAMHDSSLQVRSGAMRVLAGTLMTKPTVDFPVSKAIEALDFPDVEDRSKALSLLAALSLQPRYASDIKLNAKTQLLIQLKMNQPYVHDDAYKILTRISGKAFGDRDYAAWENWLNQPA
jgi:hypothetical protein